jgi:hypothetical protein
MVDVSIGKGTIVFRRLRNLTGNVKGRKRPEPFGPTMTGVAIRKIYLGLVTKNFSLSRCKTARAFTDGSESDATVC